MRRSRLTAAAACIALLAGSAAAQAPLKKASELFYSGKLAAALEAYRAASKKYPAEAALNAAVLLQMQGRNWEAIKWLDRARAEEPEDVRLKVALGWHYLYVSQPNRSAGWFEKARGQGTEDPMVDMGLAMAAYADRQYLRAIEALEIVTQARPRLALAHWYLGRVYEKLGDRKRAIDAYEQATRCDAHYTVARRSLARLLDREGKNEEAWKQYVKVVQYDSDDAASRRRMIQLAGQLSRPPAEVLPPRTIAAHADLRPAPRPGQLVTIGVGTLENGRPAGYRRIVFRTAKEFTVVHEATGDVLLQGQARESWVVQIKSDDPKVAEILNPQGAVAIEFSDRVSIRQTPENSPSLIMNTLRTTSLGAWAGLSDKELRGELLLSVDPQKKSFRIANRLPLEEYVYGVLTAEMPEHYPLESLKAQAVISRTAAAYLQRFARLHRRYGYDLCDSQHCQVYAGVYVESEKARTAVNETAGKIATYDGVPAHTVFHSNCGGHTQSGRDAGWSEVPYWRPVYESVSSSAAVHSPWELKQWLQGQPDVYCGRSSHVWPTEFRWTRIIYPSQIQLDLSRQVRRKVGVVRSVLPLRRSGAGNIKALKIVGSRGSHLITREHLIRASLGALSLRSTLYMVDTIRDEDGPTFIVYGGGWGHGVGLCQSGAAGRAEAGQTYDQILRAYFVGTGLSDL